MSEFPESIEAAPSSDRVGSLARGLAVMEILAEHPAGMTLTQMAEAAGLTRAGARRFLLTLVGSGYAVQEGRIFRLSPRLLTIARKWIGDASLWSFAEPFMREVSSRLNESCSAAMLSDQDIVYVARVGAARIINVELNVGTHLPAYCTAMGRVLLSALSETELEAFLARAPLVANTPKTIIGRAELTEEIAAAGRNGYAVVDEELELGLRSIAVPVRDRSGMPTAALNVSTQSARFTVAEMKREFLPHLTKAAASIEDFFAVQ